MADGGTFSGIRRVVAGVDGSDSAMQAALWAARESEILGGRPLTVVHCLGLYTSAPQQQPDSPRSESGELVESVAALIRELHPGADVETETCPLAPVQRLAELSGPDVLVVTGTRGHGWIVGKLFGSVSRGLTTQTRGPLVVVRGPRSEEDEGPVVLGVGPELSEAAADFAFETARRHRVPLHAVRAELFRTPMVGVEMPEIMPAGLGLRSTTYPLATPPQPPEDVEANEEPQVRQALEGALARYPDVRTEVICIEGDAATLLTDLGANARLVVVGARHHHRHGPFGRGAGRVAETLLAHSPAPVAVVPGMGC